MGPQNRRISPSGFPAVISFVIEKLLSANLFPLKENRFQNGCRTDSLNAGCKPYVRSDSVTGTDVIKFTFLYYSNRNGFRLVAILTNIFV